MRHTKSNIFIKGIDYLDSSSLSKFINSFWEEVMVPLSNEQVVSLIFKVSYSNGQTRSFSRSMKVTNNLRFKDIIYRNIEGYITLNSEHYEDLKVESIFIDYSISNYSLFHPNWSELRDRLESGNITDKIIIRNNQIVDYNFIPKNMDITTWNSDIDFVSGHRFAFFTYNNLSFRFKIYKDHYICTITNSGNILLRFKDILEHPRLGLDNFTRIFYKSGKDNKWNFEYEKRVYELSEVKILTKEKLDSRFLTFKGRSSKKSK